MDDKTIFYEQIKILDMNYLYYFLDPLCSICDHEKNNILLECIV